MGAPSYSGGGGGSGSVTKVSSATGELTITTTTTTPDLSIAKVPSTAVTAGTNTTIATVTGKASIASKAGTVTTVSSTTGELTIATPTTTPNLSIAKVPAAALTAGSGAAIATVTGKASLSVASAPKINTTAVTGNPAAAGKVLLSTAANAADWGTVPAGTLTSLSSFIAAAITISSATATSLTSLSLTAGTWLVIGMANALSKTAARPILVALNTAISITAILAGAEGNITATNHRVSLSFAKIVSPTATTTYYLVGYSPTNETQIQAALSAGSGNNVSGLVAVKL